MPQVDGGCSSRVEVVEEEERASEGVGRLQEVGRSGSDWGLYEEGVHMVPGERVRCIVEGSRENEREQPNQSAQENRDG